MSEVERSIRNLYASFFGPFLAKYISFSRYPNFWVLTLALSDETDY